MALFCCQTKSGICSSLCPALADSHHYKKQIKFFSPVFSNWNVGLLQGCHTTHVLPCATIISLPVYVLSILASLSEVAVLLVHKDNFGSKANGMFSVTVAIANVFFSS